MFETLNKRSNYVVETRITYYKTRKRKLEPFTVTK